MSGKSFLGNRQPRGKLIGCALVPGDAVKIYARQSGLEKRPQPYLGVCLQTWVDRASVMLLFPARGQLSAAGCLPVRNKHDQRRPMTNQSRELLGKRETTLRANVRRKKFQVTLLIKWNWQKGKKAGRSRAIESGLVLAKERFLLCLWLVSLKAPAIDPCNRLVERVLKYRSQDGCTKEAQKINTLILQTRNKPQ